VRPKAVIASFRIALVLIALAAWPAVARAEWSAPVVLSQTGAQASSGRVAVDSGGNAVFVWVLFDSSAASCCDRIQARRRSAAGALGPVQTLSTAGQNAADPRVAVDADGDATFTWTRFDGTVWRSQTRTLSKTGVLGTVQNLSAAGRPASNARVEVNAAGDAVFVWQTFESPNTVLRARARSAGGVWGPAHDLQTAANGTTEFQPEAAVDAAGDSVFTWVSSSGLAQTSFLPAGGAVSAVQNLSDPGAVASGPQVGVDSDGDAVFTWIRGDGSNDRVQARARSAAGALSAVDTLSDPGWDARGARVVVDPDGDALLAWERDDDTEAPLLGARVESRARSVGGAWGPVETLSTPGQKARSPEIAVDAGGDAVFTWSRFVDTNLWGAVARLRFADGRLAPVSAISAPAPGAADAQIAMSPSGDAVAAFGCACAPALPIETASLPAGSGWRAPSDGSASGQDSTDGQVAMNAAGDAVLAWGRSDGTNTRIQARTLSSAGVLGAVSTLSPAGQNASLPRVALDSTGDAVFVWLRFDGMNWRVQGRARSAAGVLSAVQTLSATGQNASSPRVAVDADGDAVFSWLQSVGGLLRVQTRARSAGGVLSSVQTVSPIGQSISFSGSEVAVDTDGDAVFTWVGAVGGVDRVQARARSAAGVLSAVQSVSPSTQNAENPQVAIDPAGDAVFVWSRWDSAFTNRLGVQGRARTAGGVLGTTRIVSGQEGVNPDVGVDDAGNAVVAWSRLEGTHFVVEARALSAAGVLGGVQVLSEPGQDASTPQVAVEGSGNAVIAWDRFDGRNLRAEARTRMADGSLKALTTLSDAGQDGTNARIGLSAAGAVAVWRRYDGTNFRIQLSSRP
jgi:hypothetical protein